MELKNIKLPGPYSYSTLSLRDQPGEKYEEKKKEKKMDEPTYKMSMFPHLGLKKNVSLRFGWAEW